MFGLGWQEILVVLLLFLFLFGAKKLPQIGEGFGKTVREIRKIREERKSDKDKPEKDEKGKGEGGTLVSDLKKDIEEFPGVKEIKDIKETADKVRNFTKILK